MIHVQKVQVFIMMQMQEYVLLKKAAAANLGLSTARQYRLTTTKIIDTARCDACSGQLLPVI
jgi:hypothetical protein